MTQAEPVTIEDGFELPEAKRELSTIVFPYQDLEEGIEVAKAVHELHGSTCQLEQIAAHLKLSVNSSGFKSKISTAKIFNFVTGGQGMVSLTTLGTRVCDPQQEKQARVDAFMAVPLYSKIYDQFKTSVLPPTSGLEATMGTLGVAQKQRERARQVFQRSAQQAGFFQFGTERLVMPAIRASAAASAVTQEPPPDEGKKKKKTPDGDEEPLHPFIEGLLKKLPPPDSEWPNDKRAKWLQAAINIFDLMYTESEDDSKRTITIGFQKDSARQ